MLIFYGFVFIIVVEFFGLGRHYIPGLDSLTGLLSLSLFAYIIFKYGIKEVLEKKQAKLLAFFVFLTGFAVIHGLISEYALRYFIQQVGYLILFVLAYYFLDDVKKLRLYFVVFVLVHAALSIINANKYFATVREGAFKAGYFLADGNDFGWAMVISVGFAIYIYSTEKKFIFKVIYASAFFLIVFAVLGTQSRGAAIALGSSIFYYWFMVSKKKFLGIIFIITALIVVVAYAPMQYTQRLSTISSYEEDGSAMGRIKAWGTAVEMAVDHPVLGVGAGSFNSAYGRLYRKSSDPVRWISTHSIYFKTLAEYGFPGLYILLMLIYSTWKLNRTSSIKLQTMSHNTGVTYLLPEAVNTSLIGFATAGLFLGGINYPHVFLIIAISLRIHKFVEDAASDLENNQQEFNVVVNKHD